MILIFAKHVAVGINVERNKFASHNFHDLFNEINYIFYVKYLVNRFEETM